MRGGGWKTEVGGRRGWRWAQHGSDQYYLHTKFPREWNEDGKGQDARRTGFFGKDRPYDFKLDSVWNDELPFEASPTLDCAHLFI